jgi:ATP-dependent Clp protease ATP-binding subunit ClpC
VELAFPVVVLESRPGLWRASVPWIEPLADPSTGPHRTAVLDEILQRTAEATRQQLEPADYDQLVAPENLRATTVDIAIERQVREDRPTVELTAALPVVAGEREDGLARAWLPTAPGGCVAAESPDDLPATLATWAAEWADDRDADSLAPLEAAGPPRLETTDLTLSLDPDDDSASREMGRLVRPEALHDAATNLTHLAAEGTTRRAFGREETVGELVDAITATDPSHLCLVGPPGAGKTAIIEEAVRRAIELQASYQQRRDVWRTGGEQMMAGTDGGGDWQQRALRVCRELARRNDVLVVDDLAGFALAGSSTGSANLARFLEPEMAEDRFSTIAEATDRTLDRVRQEVPGFVESFRRIRVPEMSLADTYDVAGSFVRHLESTHDVAVAPDAVETAVDLCDRYLRREALPGKAIRLLQTAARDADRRARSRPGPAEVDQAAVAHTVHRETGLPRRILDADRGRTSGEVRQSFESRVFGQPDASRTVSSLVAAIEQGLAHPDQPFASLLLIGPSGVGKTETARAMADEVFGSPHRLIRFDMSEFGEPEAASRLIGSRESPEGELTGRVRTQPHTVLLFDEVEKAHRRVLDVLLQILDDGRLTDAAGRTVDFCNTVVAMTSNLGADEANDAAVYRLAAEEFFRPEFFNRLDRIVTYEPLDRDTLRRIARRALGDILDRRGLQQPNILVDVSPELVDHLVTGATDRRYGARTLQHGIERELLTPLAHQMTRHEAGGELTRVRITPGGDDDSDIALDLTTIEPAEPLPSADEIPRGRPSRDVEKRISRLLADYEALRDSDAMADIDERHSELLEAFNEDVAADSDAGEALRQCEIIRQQVDSILDRIRDLLGEEAPGAPEMPELDAFDQTRRHRWNTRLDRLRNHLLWLARQLTASRERRVDAGTLVARGLAGPTAPLVELWWAIAGTFADIWDIEVAVAIDREGRWQPLDPRDRQRGLPLGDETQGSPAVALSAEHPGIRDVFEQLAGYLFAPQPPTRGRHALMLAAATDWGTTVPDQLASRLADSPPDAPDPRLEYRLESGRLEDLRLQTDDVCPDIDSGEFPDFARRLVLRRLEQLEVQL